MNECEGQISIDVVVKGSLKRKIALHLSISDLTANGKLINGLMSRYVHNIILLIASVNYGELTKYSLIFNSETESKCTVNNSINATNKTNLEVDEEFIVSLSFPESEEPIPQVTLEPENATIAIHEINGRSR